jgi:hypothetical protein
MSAATFVAIFLPILIGVVVALFLSMSTSSAEAESKQRRARELARYRHHPDANLLSLNR